MAGDLVGPLDRFQAALERLACEVFLRDGWHAPVVVAEMPDRRLVGLLVARDPAARRRWFEALCRRGARAIGFVSEAWAALVRDELERARVRRWVDAGRSLGDLPGRQEVLVVSSADPRGTRCTTWRIARRDGRVRLVDEHRSTCVRGVLSGLPWTAGAPGDEGGA